MANQNSTPLLDAFSPLFEDFRSLITSEKGAFLVTLAALDAGYDVVFSRTQNAVKAKFKFIIDEFPAAQFIRVSAPRRSASPVFFDATCPLERTTAKKLITVNDKLLTKKVFHDAGVLSPFGGAAHAGNLNILETFKRRGVRRVIVKPLRGSLAKGILSYVSPEVAARHIASMRGEVFIVEQPVEGREFRTYVADGQVVAATERIPAHVIGDGRSSIQSLIEAENTYRAAHPEYATRLINAEAAAYKLDVDKRSVDDVPEDGERVELTLSTTTSTGTTYQYGLETVPEDVIQASIDAAKALKLRFVALDVRLHREGGPYILEGNGRPGIAAASLPYRGDSWNPHLAREILRMVFPKAEWNGASVRRFEFSALKDALSDPRGKGVVAARDYAEVT